MGTVVALVMIASACGSADAGQGDGNQNTVLSGEASSATTLASGEPTDAEDREPTSAAAPTTAPGTTGPSTTEATSTTTTSSPITSTTAPTTVPTTAVPFDGPASCSAAVGATTFNLDAGGVVHEVRVFLPEGISDDASLPVVLNFHGFGQSGIEQAIFSDYERTAAREGFIVVHPTGVPAPGNFDNAWELLEQDFADRDDAAMVESLITIIADNYCGDRSRVYATGFSNGGYFTSRLVCQLSDTIAAAVSVGALTHPDNCEPSRAVPYMAFHGTNDNVVAFDGGATPNAGDLINQVIPDEFAEFAADYECDTDAVESRVTDEVIRYDYVGCIDDVPLVFFEIVGGGHTWPGSPSGPLVTGQLGATTTDVSATDDGWAFLSQFSLPE